jgi:hypothetical protein
VTSGPRANGKTADTFDLQAAAKAAASEASRRPFAFTYKTKRYQVPPALDWPVAALAALAEGNLEGALTELLGEQVYERLVKAGLTVGELNALFSKLGAEAGFPSLPNSPLAALPSSTPT